MKTFPLSKKTYREVIRRLQHYRDDFERDREEHPNAIPSGYRSQISYMVENTVRKNREHYYKGLDDVVIRYLVDQKLLVNYHGDVTFPSSEELPSVNHIERAAIKAMT